MNNFILLLITLCFLVVMAVWLIFELTPKEHRAKVMALVGVIAGIVTILYNASRHNF